MRKSVNSHPGSASWTIGDTAFVLLLVWAMTVACGSLAAQSVTQSAPPPNRNITAPAPQAHSPQTQRQPIPRGVAAPQPMRQLVGDGRIEGFVYWDTSATSHVPAGDCSGLAVNVAVAESSSGPFTTMGTLSNNFKYVGQVKQFLVGGKVKVFDVCTYGYPNLPLGPNLRVTVNITSPAAFSPVSALQNPLISPINIINAQCNMLPRIVNPTAADLFAKWGTCQNMAFDVNFEITNAEQSLSSGARVQRGAGAARISVGSGGSTLLNGPGDPSLLNQPGATPPSTQSGIGTQSQPSSGTLLGNNAGTRQPDTEATGRSTPGSKVELNPQPFPPKQVLTNHDVLTMLNARLAESVILSSLRSSPHRFDFSYESCRALERAHVSSNILNVMGDGSVRPCPAITVAGALNGGDLAHGSRQAITDITNRGPGKDQNRAPGIPGLQPVKLAPPTASRRVTNPHLSEQNASIIAVLEQQRQLAQQVAAAMKAGLRTIESSAAARPVALTANLHGDAPPQELTPGQTQSAHGDLTSMTHAPAFNSLVLTCATNPTPRILRVNGGQAPGIFTPEAKYNLYTIVGCSFGQSQTGNSAYIFAGNGFKANLNIDFWSENGITVHLDPYLAGVRDQSNVSLVVCPAGEQPIQQQGFRFYAARGMPNPDESDQEVPLSYDSMPQSSVKLYDATPVLAAYNQLPSNATSQFPSFSFQGTPVAGWVFRYAYGHRETYQGLIGAECFINDVGYQFNDPSHPCWSYFSDSSPFGSDTWDFSKLVPGFVISAYELYYEDTDPTKLCGSWDDYRKDSGLLSNWDFNLTGPTNITVVWPLSWCRDTELPPSGRTNEQKQSIYGLEVWVLGPRCIDPWTGHKDQACMSKVKQNLS